MKSRVKVQFAAIILVIFSLNAITSAVKLKKVDKPNDKADTSETLNDSKREKEVHKRGIFHSGGALGWPKTYASHFGYSLNFPASSSYTNFATHAHPTGILKYTAGLHYKGAYAGLGAAPAWATSTFGTPAISASPTFAASAFAAPAYGTAAYAPAFATSAVASVPHSVHAVGAPHLHAHAPAPSYVLRPGNAHVSSYSVSYPRYQHKPAYSAVAHLTPVQHLHPVQQTIPTAVQTTFVQPALPAAPAIPAIPAAPSFPSLPSFPSFPSFPAAPSLPAVPALPSIPSFPQFPSFQIPPSVSVVPAQPAVPAAPALPAVPAAPPAPFNPVFPTTFQPPNPQQPPTFGSFPVQPAVSPQFPGIFPQPVPAAPESGSDVASPQIPTPPPQPAPAPEPEPELPSVQSQLPQQPWRPMLYNPPTANGPAPSHTLLPPYGSGPSNAYLPPDPSQQQQLSANLFDNLTDAEVEHIFAQANQAAQHHHHHYSSAYRNRY